MSRRARWIRNCIVILSLAVGATAWEIGGRYVGEAFMAPLSDTISRLWELLQSGVLLRALVDSLSLFAVGFVLAILCGFPLGLLLARVRPLRVSLESYVTMLYATPMVALIPFILSLMGFGFTPKVLVVFLFAVFPVLYNTIEGARSVKPELIEVASSFRSSEWELWRDVMIPFTLPYVATGIRQAIARGLVGMVAAEFFLSPSGLGQLIIVGSYNFDTAAMLAAVLVVVVLGVTLMEAGHYLESRLAVWRRSAQ
ncbi:MAG TPA: ABC transporter permease subunit [Pseudolabrys sp.]|jgi:NitT/TauT family transport system permease protein|nr:ABC transporter permease subunit [Pseudolabrys sp.]